MMTRRITKNDDMKDMRQNLLIRVVRKGRYQNRMKRDSPDEELRRKYRKDTYE